MYIIVLGVFILKLQTSVSQFPDHMDLQKVGDVIFNNEKFSILKPTTHVVIDYFKEFMLRRDNNNFPTKRVFIDDNGFRHAWSGFGKKIKSLRKTDLINKIESDENSANKNAESTIKSMGSNENTTASVDNTTISKNNEVDENGAINASQNSGTVQKFAQENTETPVSKETTTMINVFRTTQENNSNTEISLEYKLRKGKTGNKTKATQPAKTTPKTTKAPTKSSTKKENSTKKDEAKTPNNGTAKLDNDGKKQGKIERTIAKTTFFCPFFGVITMSAFID